MEKTQSNRVGELNPLTYIIREHEPTNLTKSPKAVTSVREVRLTEFSLTYVFNTILFSREYQQKIVEHQPRRESEMGEDIWG